MNSRKLEHGLKTIRAGFPFSKPFGVWGIGYSNFLVFTVAEGTSRNSEFVVVVASTFFKIPEGSGAQGLYANSCADKPQITKFRVLGFRV